MIRINPVSGDSQPIVQEFINAVLGPADPLTSVRQATEGISLGAGDFYLNSPLSIQSAQGLIIEGEGGATRLRPQFAGQAVLDMNGVARCTLQDFWIVGTKNEAVDYGIYLRWDGKQARSTSTNAIRNIMIADLNYVTAVQVGQPGLTVQCDLTDIENLEIDGRWIEGQTALWQKGLCLGSGAWGNNYAHRCAGLSITGNARNLSVEASGCVVTGKSLGAGGVDIWADPGSCCTFRGLECQNSESLLRSPIAGSPFTVSLEDVSWKSNNLSASGQVISHGLGGVLRIAQLLLSTTTGPPRIVLDGGVPQMALIDGMAVLGGYTQAQCLQAGPLAKFVVRGFVQTAPSGHVVDVS